MLLFVYGTMMRHCRNHNRLWENGAVYIGEFTTAHNFSMYVRRNSAPVAIRNSCGRPVFGELYAIEDHRVHSDIDPFEGHPQLYKREYVKLQGFNDTNDVAVEMYVFPDDRLNPEIDDPVVPVNDVLSWTTRRESAI